MIGLNAAVFGAWQLADANKDVKLQRQPYDNATLSEGNIQSGRSWTMITSAFSHKDFTHFVFNMVGLHAFGRIISMVPGVGTVKFMALAFGSAATGSLAWLYHTGTKDRPQPQRNNKNIWSRFGEGRTIVRQINVALGASGLVMGLGAAAACLSPFTPMNIMFIPISIPLFVTTGLYFAADTYFLKSNSGIGHSAHLRGAVFGAAFYLGALRNYGGVWKMAQRALLRR